MVGRLRRMGTGTQQKCTPGVQLGKEHRRNERPRSAAFRMGVCLVTCLGFVGLSGQWLFGVLFALYLTHNRAFL